MINWQEFTCGDCGVSFLGFIVAPPNECMACNSSNITKEDD